MKKLLSIPAYMWAIICMLLIPITFVGNDGFAEKLSQLSFMKIHPVFSGGEVSHSYEKDGLTITVNKPVFEALIGESNHGFVQVRFAAVDSLPANISQAIDIDADGSDDFRLNIHTLTGETAFESLSQRCTALDVSSMVKRDWIVRVKMKNE